ncbi:MAG: serine/threonine protein kinase [Pleurocapsa minor GSE-CHR-MK-17-07R]|jgi:serine/threonine protein kinase|nr:serine/threonine protein kinase [Pleurocapsa minor GSE-CHR-MK 17-07R]
MAEFVNSRLDRYEIRERVGTGGMARVYKAWDTKLERLVAIKILHEHLADESNFKDRFEREARTVAAFDHPNIVRIFDYNVMPFDGVPIYYMVMSYIPGQTLRQLLEDVNRDGGKLPHERVVRLIDNLTDALGYAHDRGMAHRDVKPGNILLDERGNAVLTDFGIARMVQSTRLTQDGISSGTPAYMSPEQAAGDSGDQRSDLYSLAVILYELLAGKTPFPDEGSLSVMLKHINTPPPVISEVLNTPNAKLDLFMSKALAKMPDERFQTAREFNMAFKRIYREDVVTAEMLSLPMQTERPTTVVPSPRLHSHVTGQLTGPQQTSIFRTISQTIQQNPRASTGFFVLVGVIVVLLIGLLVLQRPQSAAPSDSAGAQPEATAMSSGFFRTRFNPGEESLIYWPVGDVGALETSISDGLYRVINERPQRAETITFGGGNDYTNISITMESVLDPESAEASAYGIVWRYQDADNFNVFAVDGLGRFSIWTRNNGSWVELRALDEDWTEADAINPRGESNLLAVDVIGNTFTAYVNNTRVVRLSDDTFANGAVGIYIASDDGAAIIDIDRYQVFQSVPSMTGQ